MGPYRFGIEDSGRTIHPMGTAEDALEARTQAIGGALVAAARDFRPPAAERLQDRLLVGLSVDADLRGPSIGEVEVVDLHARDVVGLRARLVE